MAIGPIEIQGAITRTQDYSQIRHNEINKGQVDQSLIATATQKSVETKASAVNAGDDVTNFQKQFDARDKGSNEYNGDGGQNRKQSKQQTDGRVFVKGSNSTFDIKI